MGKFKDFLRKIFSSESSEETEPEKNKLVKTNLNYRYHYPPQKNARKSKTNQGYAHFGRKK